MQKKHRKTPPPFKNEEDYIGDTNEKTYGSNISPSETDGCARNMSEEHKNEDDEKFSENTSEINKGIKLITSKGIT